MRPIFELGKLVDLRHDAGGRDRNAVRHDKEPVLVRHDLERGDQIVKIEKRLAGSHSDQVCAVRRLAADAVNVIEHNNYLLDDLAGGQISQQPELCRQAKIAFERAARLRRKTDRIAVLGRDIDRLDRIAV